MSKEQAWKVHEEKIQAELDNPETVIEKLSAAKYDFYAGWEAHEKAMNKMLDGLEQRFGKMVLTNDKVNEMINKKGKRR